MPKTRFTEGDIERACSGMRKARIPIAMIEVRPDGSILVTTVANRNAHAEEPTALPEAAAP
jgi:hypothetical protein